MIAKHFPMKNQAKSSVASLVKYLEDKKTNERVADVHINNCVSIETDCAVLEIINTQNINQKVTSDKTFHMVLSCAAEDKVSNEQLQEMAQKMITALGYKEHQSIVIIHDDTDNKHAHIVINKIHPKTFKSLSVKGNYKIMSDVCSELEDEYGLTKVNHNARKTKSENLADDFERHTGIKSLLNWVKEVCEVEIHNAENWKDFHKVLAEHDLVIKQKANGLVIESKDGQQVKASSVGREYSKQNLEKKFGTFVPMEEKAKEKIKVKARYVEKPISKGFDTTELYALYKRHQTQAIDARIKTQATAKERKASLIKSAKLSAKAKRETLKLMKISRDSKKILYKAISNSLMERLGDIHKDYRKSLFTNAANNKLGQTGLGLKHSPVTSKPLKPCAHARTNQT
jgi:Relaxase/Mobilisation nuclease domain